MSDYLTQSREGAKEQRQSDGKSRKMAKKWIAFFIIVMLGSGLGATIEKLTGYSIDFFLGWLLCIFAYELGIVVPHRLRGFAALRESQSPRKLWPLGTSGEPE